MEYDLKILKVEESANLAWEFTKKSADLWHKLNPWAKSECTRIYYIQVWDAPKIHTGLTSLEATKLKTKKPTEDHWTIPQFTAWMMLENPDVFLVDKEVFIKIFKFNCGVIWVTSDENTALSKYTSKTDKTIKCSFDERYRKENIQLFLEGGGNIDIDSAMKLLNPPAEYLEIQQKYINGTI
jgi:hypothetical protein